MEDFLFELYYWTISVHQRLLSLHLFQFKCMPFGPCNVATTSYVEGLGRGQGQICFVYIDNIIVYSPSSEQHLRDLASVFQKLQLDSIRLNMKKLHFLEVRVEIFRTQFPKRGVEVDPAKTQAVTDLPVPQDLTSLQRFLGLAGWYHKFIPHFSETTATLNQLKTKVWVHAWISAQHGCLEIGIEESPSLHYSYLSRS